MGCVVKICNPTRCNWLQSVSNMYTRDCHEVEHRKKHWHKGRYPFFRCAHVQARLANCHPTLIMHLLQRHGNESGSKQFVVSFYDLCFMAQGLAVSVCLRIICCLSNFDLKLRNVVEKMLQISLC